MTISNALSARLAGPSLLKTGGLINGTWLEASSAASIFDIANPANGEVIATLAEMGPAETKTSIDAAYEA